MPWKAQSQKRSSAQRNDAWNTESNILGTQLFTRKLSGNSGSVENKILKIPSYTDTYKITADLPNVINVLLMSFEFQFRLQEFKNQRKFPKL